MESLPVSPRQRAAVSGSRPFVLSCLPARDTLSPESGDESPHSKIGHSKSRCGVGERPPFTAGRLSPIMDCPSPLQRWHPQGPTAVELAMFETGFLPVVVAVTFVASYSLVGLLAIWVGLGRPHWFLRVAVWANVVLTLLAIPAYEPMLLFSIQLLVAVVPLAVVRTWRARRAATAAGSSQARAGRPLASAVPGARPSAADRAGGGRYGGGGQRAVGHVEVLGFAHDRSLPACS